MQFGKYFSLAALAAPLATAAAVDMSPRDEGLSISWATAYLNETLNIADYGCGTAVKGTALQDYTKFVDVLGKYTALIATPWAAADKSACGQCVAVSYTTTSGLKRTVYAVTVDATGGYFNLDKAGFAGLDGYDGFAAGTLVGSAVTVPLEKCLRAA
ncbi:hypothetical protein N0V93_003063 [Gnomoniopsis smithogilvyi]|uniref:Allergen Asp f 15 n=1 Tax=Gnomoniopsis smithogilvyi TaxID=1191159 RepID=A0A9W8YXV1_9PEZI|nr:hypothetical protein N0V93_003063 [Gnomoniopsis smithogilvyi]